MGSHFELEPSSESMFVICNISNKEESRCKSEPGIESTTASTSRPEKETEDMASGMFLNES
jgi:hypothetical protein